MKKVLSKVAKKCSKFFLSTAWAAQTTETEKNMFQNVAYRPTVHKTGVSSTNCIEWFWIKSVLSINCRGGGRSDNLRDKQYVAQETEAF